MRVDVVRRYNASSKARAAQSRYRNSDKGRAKVTRYNWARALRRVRVRMALKVERIRQLELELGAPHG